MATLYLMRHGQTEFNVRKLVQEDIRYLGIRAILDQVLADGYEEIVRTEEAQLAAIKRWGYLDGGGKGTRYPKRCLLLPLYGAHPPCPAVDGRASYRDRPLHEGIICSLLLSLKAWLVALWPFR